MTIEISARNAKGYELATYDALDEEDAVSWMVSNRAPRHVDGFIVEGTGIIRCIRTVEGHHIGFQRLINGEFVTGGPDLIFA